MPYKTWYAPGDWNVLDDLSGFRIKHSRARTIPLGGETGGLLVDTKRWETTHPQNMVRGVADQQTIPGTECRPRQTNQFVVVGSWITTFAPRFSNMLTLDSTVGFIPGHILSIMLDNGENYSPVLLSVAGNQIMVSYSIRYTVGGNIGDPIENSVLQLGPSDAVFLTNDQGQYILTDWNDAIQIPGGGGTPPPTQPTGTYLVSDTGALIVTDTGQPILIDQGTPPPVTYLTDDAGNLILDDAGNPIQVGGPGA